MVASHVMAGNMGAIEGQRAVGTQQIVGGVPKGTHPMAAIYPAIDMAVYPIRCLRHHLLHICMFEFFNFTA